MLTALFTSCKAFLQPHQHRCAADTNVDCHLELRVSQPAKPTAAGAIPHTHHAYPVTTMRRPTVMVMMMTCVPGAKHHSGTLRIRTIETDRERDSLLSPLYHITRTHLSIPRCGFTVELRRKPHRASVVPTHKAGANCTSPAPSLGTDDDDVNDGMITASLLENGGAQDGGAVEPRRRCLRFALLASFARLGT